MGIDIEALLTNVALAQTEVSAEAAPLWVEYLIYGVAVALMVFVVVRALRKRSPDLAPRREVPQPTLTDPRTEREVRARARSAFRAPLAPAKKPEPKKPEVAEPSAPAEVKKPPQLAKAPAKAPAAKAKPATPPPEPPRPAAPEAAGRTLREGLARTHDGFVKKLGLIFGGAKTIDDGLLGELEEALFSADIGVRTSQKLVERVHEALGKKELQDPQRVWGAMKRQITDMLKVEDRGFDLARAKPLVIMVVGVNGAGKTTTIGKLARTYADQGKRVLLAAGDTFRAAAVEQLEVWASRAGVPVVRGGERQDPSSVIFEAVKRAVDEGFDVVIADTAGRLQAKKELMDELGKVHRVIGKAMPGAPHEVWLVLDSTNGQNAISQAKEFTQVVDVTGLVLTKLDGTAKGGVVIGICDEMRLPVRYIGIGEKVEDLRAFDAEAFAEALFAGA